MLKRIPLFTVRIVYKSGYTHDFEVYKFKMKGNTIEWNSANDQNKPIHLGLDEIAAVYQMGYRNVWRWVPKGTEL